MNSFFPDRRHLKKFSCHVTGFGMTEIGVTHVNRKDDFKHNSVGKLMPLVEQKVNKLYLSRYMTKLTKRERAQRRLRSAWASAQSDQSSLSA